MTDIEWHDFTDIVAPYLSRLTGPLKQDTNLEEAGLESLSLIELVADIENRAGIEYPAEDLSWETFSTAGSLYEKTVTLVENR